jgi:hypothetical protein
MHFSFNSAIAGVSRLRRLRPTGDVGLLGRSGGSSLEIPNGTNVLFPGFLERFRERGTLRQCLADIQIALGVGPHLLHRYPLPPA